MTMRNLMLSAAALFSLAALLSIPERSLAADAGAMQVITIQNISPVEGPAANFTVPPKVRALFKGEDPSTLSAGAVSFSPKARSAWHTHPKGQLLVVTSGTGLVQELGKPARLVHAGEVIWTPPGVRHWHGATPDSEFSHIAVQESEKGQNVNWMQKVTDEEYQSAVKGAQP